MMSSSVRRKLLMLPPLMFALWVLTDDEVDNIKSSNHHLAVFTALKRHPPSLRVYRALLELTLLLFGTSFSIYIWTRTVGSKVVGELLFQPPQDSSELALPQNQDDNLYEPVSADDYSFEQSTMSTRELEMENESDDDQEVEGEVPSVASATRTSACGTGSSCPLPPTASSVLGAALDLLLLVLVSLFFFTISSAEGGRYIDGIQETSTLKMLANIAAPIFPLILFVVAVVVTFFPWKRRRHFWIILSFTIGAPFFDVSFRDGFVGDILTSAVRPLQDLAFTTFYIMSGLQGWWTQNYDLDEAATPVERSWVLHTIILPACMVSPLWWRFNQNLRQIYDSKKRWPYLGNALKYLVAAEVAMFGVFDPNKKENYIWLVCYFVATLYQVWWDVFMDWELLSFDGPFKVSIRTKRFYPRKIVYWGIFIANFVLRFCWILTFLPNRYLDSTGSLRRTFGGDLSGLLSPVLASAEIIRRTLWGLLRFELEAIKNQAEDPSVKAQLSRVSGCKDHDSHHGEGTETSLPEDFHEEFELHPLAEMDDKEGTHFPMPILDIAKDSQLRIDLQDDTSKISDLKLLLELCAWATVFCSGGIVAAADRGTF